MKKPVIRVKHDVGSVTPQRADLLDYEALSDAERCAHALAKRFGKEGFTFSTRRVRCADHLIEVDVSELSPVDSFKLFAEGFMASEHLWER